MLEAQILANIHKIETKPMEYSAQLKRILSRNPLMTEAELATGETMARDLAFCGEAIEMRIALKVSGSLGFSKRLKTT